MLTRLKRGSIILAVCALFVPLAMALLAAPASGQEPTLVVSSPSPGAVVEGDVVLQGSAEDPDGNLDAVWIGVDREAPPMKIKLKGATFNATWERSWNSQSVRDGQREVSIFAVDEAGESSEPVNFTLIVDNDKEPMVEAVNVRFDSEADFVYKLWNDLEAVPTTRVAFEFRFGEQMEETTLREALSFSGGGATWELEPQADERVYWINVSYLEVDTAYNLTIGNSTSDMAGNLLTTAYDLSFHTAAQATPGTPQPGGTFFLPIDPFWIWIGGGVGGGAIAGVVLHRKGLLRKVPEFFRSLPDRLRRRES